ncbi:MAG: hypothetical protein IKW13_00600, partial [Thermoguttaceae bacterium]|nr:hypothetical protein [Thermoguttaceae bacterium]
MAKLDAAAAKGGSGAEGASEAPSPRNASSNVPVPSSAAPSNFASRKRDETTLDDEASVRAASVSEVARSQSSNGSTRIGYYFSSPQGQASILSAGAIQNRKEEEAEESDAENEPEREDGAANEGALSTAKRGKKDGRNATTNAEKNETPSERRKRGRVAKKER